MVIVWFHRGQVEEYRRAVLAGLAVQRCGDQVPDAARGQHVLRREQSIIAGQVHAATHRHRFT
ncbi:hypothetical protein DMA12_43745 [Amycolatopsis balhimycina DSM 5908]|uniref:Uncharacterized protein n=1 Tax=Amycolatopsis balhimycina DSM 5908 TaxID=1081091 RepID=A0A428VXF9_AMYBA|nr:hypothetical protein DMA12_43745 [Amycolatopsis balhimycina DSM 5908]